MANDGKIYIYISDRKLDAKSDKSTTKEKSKSDLIRSFALNELSDFVRAEANQIVNNTINNIGNFTGDYQAQREAKGVVNIAKSISNIGMSFVAGTVATGGNVVGGAIAAGISTFTQLTNTIMTEAVNQVSINNQNYEISRLREISGLNGLTNGSRI